MPTLQPQDERYARWDTLTQDEKQNLLGEITAPYNDGTKFTSDFWMEGLVGAMAGASVEDYMYANRVHGYLGGQVPRHVHVVGPDVPDAPWNAAMTTSGDNGWNPFGASYFYDPDLYPEDNYARWIAAGCPSKSNVGEGRWGAMGVPYSYELWTRQNPATRGPSPLPRPRKGRGYSHGRDW